MSTHIKGHIKGFYKIHTTNESQPRGTGKYMMQERITRRSGESRMREVEKLLRAQGIHFVEDFENDGTVIVRYGTYANDETQKSSATGGIE
jgi:hypothetical protein